MLEPEVAGLLKKGEDTQGKKEWKGGKENEIKREAGINIYRKSTINQVYCYINIYMQRSFSLTFCPQFT